MCDLSPLLIEDTRKIMNLRYLCKSFFADFVKNKDTQ